jgi:hypothetical protein
VEDAYVFIPNVDGYGRYRYFKTIIKLEKPDAIFFITDPRYYKWLFENENEFRVKMPFIYLKYLG